jgi:creatinine amidohydrolase
MPTKPTASEIASLNWVEFDKKSSTAPVTIIPTGAVEVYGPHLPLASDSIVAQGVARILATRLTGLCAPLIPVGYSADLMSFPGTISVNPDAFVGYLHGICESLSHWGINNFVFLNTHLGNVTLIDQEADILTREYGAKCLQIDWWRYSARVCRDLFTSGDLAVGHAGELGTSVLLYFARDLVDLDSIVDFIPTENPWLSGLIPYISYREYTSTGVVGKPSEGSFEKGELIVARSVEAIANDCNSFFKLKDQ